MRVEVRCRIEDLEITDLVLKDDTIAQVVKRSVGFDNRRAAAEAYIRSLLSREGLRFENIHDPFGVIALADVAVEELPE